jgi:hypothetical protein
MWPVFCEGRQPYQRQRLLYALAPLAGRQIAVFEAKLHVLLHGPPGEQAIFLEQIGNALPVRETAGGYTLQRDLAAVGGKQPGNQVQQGAFAAARGPEQGNDLAAVDG